MRNRTTEPAGGAYPKPAIAIEQGMTHRTGFGSAHPSRSARCMKLALILVNLIAALITFGSARVTSKSDAFAVMSVYEKLDKDSLINRNKAAELFPDINLDGQNKYEIPIRYLNNTPRSGITPMGAWRLHTTLSCLFILNAVLIGVFMKGKWKAEPSGGAYGSPGAGSPSAHP